MNKQFFMGTGEQPLVECIAVNRIYGSGTAAVRAVDQVSLRVTPGSLVAIRGRSGSGKTTLLNLIGGLDRPDGGQVLFAGEDLVRLSEGAMTRWRRRRVSFIFQTFALLPVLSALENVEVAAHIAGIGYRERQARARQVLEWVGLHKRMHHRPYELSGGEQQRVAIARALVNQPDLILADEPTGELDSATGLRIMELLRGAVQERGVTVCLATHDPAVLEIADATYAMRDGRLEGREERLAAPAQGGSSHET